MKEIYDEENIARERETFVVSVNIHYKCGTVTKKYARTKDSKNDKNKSYYSHVCLSTLPSMTRAFLFYFWTIFALDL